MQLLDKANEATDRKLARHLISLYGNGVGRLGNEVGGWVGAQGGGSRSSDEDIWCLQQSAPRRGLCTWVCTTRPPFTPPCLSLPPSGRRHPCRHAA